ncbi:hypothetical protein OV079_51265 [Nannocystis pusilla]|uniref:Uncharacterized protein n=1 Tax=Nannocystis pusilla TaxID=889268 RepID=A0A9X3F0F8_9BACT|nr:hypothetical protein [Nannocystis pusilla]MCY1013772.1 hypothetical protein [Nannocystis pusilla]
MSDGTYTPADAIVVRVGADPGPADLRLPDDASAGPTAYVELRLLTAPEADEHAADDEEAADARPLLDLPAPPALPAPYLVHPYFQSRAFTGRAADLAELDAWLAHGRPARVLVALGGVGKSALAWAWTLRRLADAPWAGCMWWSSTRAARPSTACSATSRSTPPAWRPRRRCARIGGRSSGRSSRPCTRGRSCWCSTAWSAL